MACDAFCANHGCNQGPGCAARAKPIRRTDPGIEGVFTVARNGIDRVIALERMLAEERERTQQLSRTITALRLTVTVNCDRVLQLIEKMEGKQ